MPLRVRQQGIYEEPSELDWVVLWVSIHDQTLAIRCQAEARAYT